MLSPRLRLFLYVTAGVIFSLWLSLELFGGAGFVAFALGMVAAQLAFRWRPSVNGAFVAGIAVYGLTLLIWTAAFGTPRPSNLHATQTAANGDSSAILDRSPALPRRR